jgi:addiction module RelB/DinJ family antitoxin
MNTKTQLLIKTDKKLKEEAQKVAKAMGLPLGTVVNNYLKRFVIDRKVEFEAPLIPNAKTAKLLREVEDDIKNGRMENFSRPFETAEEMIAELNS